MKIIRVRSLLIASLLFLTPLFLTPLFLTHGNSGSVIAQERGLDHPLDRLMQFDDQIASYGLVAVGDLNGDGRDDIVAQGVLRPISDISTRWLELHLGAMQSASEDGISYPAATFALDRGASAAVTTLGDLNGDGVADLVYAAASRRNVEAKEAQRVSIMLGRETWDPFYYLGEASRGDRKLEHVVTLPPDMQRNRPSRLALRAADLNDDGHLDIILAVDPPVPQGGEAFDPPDPAEGESEILIMFGDGKWLSWLEADPELGREGGWVDRGPFRADVRITGLGHCARSLGDIADVTGDGKLDVVVRRCPGGELPDLPGVIPGRADWPAEIKVQGAVIETATMPDPDPSPVESGTAPMPEGLSARLLDPLLRQHLARPALDQGVASQDYVRRPEPPRGVMAAAPPLLGRDLSGDGVADLLLASGSDIHIWLGGPDIGANLLSGRSDRIFLGASLAGAALSDAWRPADLDGDGDLELLLARHVAPPAGESDPSTAPPPGPLYIFDGDWQTRAVLDLVRDSPPPAAIWRDPILALAGIADIDGDGRSDVLVASDPRSDDALVGALLGPVLR